MLSFALVLLVTIMLVSPSLFGPNEYSTFMFNLLLSALCWNAFKATPESNAKRRRYNLSTNFSRH